VNKNHISAKAVHNRSNTALLSVNERYAPMATGAVALDQHQYRQERRRKPNNGKNGELHNKSSPKV